MHELPLRLPERDLVLRYDTETEPAEDFAALFCETWLRIPQEDRKIIVAHWAAAVSHKWFEDKCSSSEWTNLPRVELVRELLPLEGVHKGTAGFATEGGLFLQYKYFPDMSRDAVIAVIGHELAHTRLYADAAEWAAFIGFNRLEDLVQGDWMITKARDEWVEDVKRAMYLWHDRRAPEVNQAWGFDESSIDRYGKSLKRTHSE